MQRQYWNDFFLRLDEQGLEISSPWESSPVTSLLETLWPRLHKAWLEKECWAGCHDNAEEVRREWDQAQLCLKACQKLGSAEPAILLTAHSPRDSTSGFQSRNRNTQVGLGAEKHGGGDKKIY